MFFCAITATVAGSAGFLLVLLDEHINKWKNSRLHLIWLKTVLLLYIFPLAIIPVIGLRIDSFTKNTVWMSEFLHVSTQPMRKLYMTAAGVWILGLGAGIVFRFVQYRKLKYILKENYPIEDSQCQKMIQEYKAKYKQGRVDFYHNDLTDFPICTGGFHPKIILPVKNYTEKELHMVLEHEMNHIRGHDLMWKKMGLLVSFIHWWNPLVYLLLRKLILQEEIECDMKTCENNSYFSMKEYGYFLAGMESSQDDMMFVSALCKTKKDLFKRLEGMVKGKSYKKWIAVVSSMMLLLMSMFPSYAASEGWARENEKWIANTEIAIEEQKVNYYLLEKTSTVMEDAEVEEIDLTVVGEPVPLGGEVTLDHTVNANTRILYCWQQMHTGDQVPVIAKCSDSSIVYRIGIKEKSGALTYVEGSGNQSHIFTISVAGEYTVYVENRSNVSAKITGNALYPD
ncbi:MAG: M56 family metallopeptidase [Lachnospiraceae bacterium]